MKVARECADVANMALMVADVVGGLDEEVPEREAVTIDVLQREVVRLRGLVDKEEGRRRDSARRYGAERTRRQAVEAEIADLTERLSQWKERDRVNEAMAKPASEHPELEKFADECRDRMLAKLVRHADKGHWLGLDHRWLLEQGIDHCNEMAEVCSQGLSRKEAFSEAADIANYAFMAADAYRLKCEAKPELTLEEKGREWMAWRGRKNLVLWRMGMRDGSSPDSRCLPDSYGSKTRWTDTASAVSFEPCYARWPDISDPLTREYLSVDIAAGFEPSWEAK